MTGELTNRNKHALLIGINNYPNFDARHQLHGCVNDVELIAQILQENFRFPEGNMTIVRNEQATQAGIRAQMNQLIGRVGKDDIVVIHFSGHGSQMTDIHGDEASGKDNTIVPYDSGRAPYPNHDIVDDEIHLWLAQLTQKTRYITLLFDCCHSGTITRDPFGDTERWVPPDTRPPDQLQWDMTGSPLVEESVGVSVGNLSRGGRDLGPSGWLALSEGYVLLAGCADAESAYELTTSANEGRITHGALTYFLSQELRQAKPGATYRDLFERIKPLVTAQYPYQHPQIEGRQDRILFDIHDVEALRFVTVIEHKGDTVRLAAGAAHGMTVDSQWVIYSQETKVAAIEAGATRLGLVEITNVSALFADAKIVEATAPNSIKAGCYAVEYAHNYGDMQWVVAIHPPPAGYQEHVQPLKEYLQMSRLLRPVTAGDSGTAADLCIYLIPPRPAVGETDPVPQLGAVTRATWVVIGRDGRSAMPPHEVDEANVLSLLYANLEKLARYRNTLVLKNANPNHRLKGKVDFILKYQKEDRSWEAVGAGANEAMALFAVDDRIAFEIVNRHHAPVYVSVLDFGLTGAISLLYPPDKPSEKIEAGVQIKIGERDEDKIELWIPDTFPDDQGVETFKLFITTQETDFSWIQQGAVRSIDLTRNFASPFQQLFDRVYSGLDTRDARLPMTEEWTTVEQRFTLRRKQI